MVQSIVSVPWLHAHRADPEVVVVDVRPPAFFLQGHIPGAVNLPGFFLGGPVAPDPGQVGRRLGALGIRPGSHVVGYDDGSGTMAARLYWVLRFFRHDAVSVLDGGMTAWAHEGHEYEHQVMSRAPVPYEVRDRNPSTFASADEVRAAVGDSETIIVDARTPAEYLGLQVSAARDGHIPGAINVDVAAHRRRGTDGIARFLPEAELRALYESAGVTPDKPVIVHCQTGNRSSETFLVLEALGYDGVRNYVAGWQEWGNLPDTPVEPG